MGGPHRGSSWWQYTKATDQPETWTPRFYYLGSRYVQVDELADADESKAPAVLDAIEAVVVHSAATPVGTFSSSSEVLNRIHEMVRWSQRSNMVSVITDCPHREKLGWIEQLHLNGPSLRYAFDLNRSFEKAMHDMADAQAKDGLVPNVAPEYVEFEGPFRNAAEWGAAFILVPWQQYLFTGDDTLLRRHYDAMVRYFGFLESRAKDDILSDGLGDWYDFDLAIKGRANLTPPAFTATAFYHEDARVLSKIAGLLGNVEDEQRLRATSERIRQRFVQEFYRPETGAFSTGSQAANAMALALGLVEPAHRDLVMAALVRDVETRGYASAGDVGFGYLLRALAANGRSDLVLRLVLQDDKPGYAYQLKNGATALAEAWDGNLGVSQNHIILGQIVEWLYRDLAGLDPDEARPGFAHVNVRPTPLDGVSWVDASYASGRGAIAARWERDGAILRLAVTLPPNTTGTVYLPLPREGAVVTEGGRTLARAAGVSLLRREPGRLVLAIASGRYDLEAR